MSADSPPAGSRLSSVCRDRKAPMSAVWSEAPRAERGTAKHLAWTSSPWIWGPACFSAVSVRCKVLFWAGVAHTLSAARCGRQETVRRPGGNCTDFSSYKHIWPRSADPSKFPAYQQHTTSVCLSIKFGGTCTL